MGGVELDERREGPVIVLALRASAPHGRPLRVLCLGAHSDDIEIGCGGTMLTLLGAGRPVEVHWVVFSGCGRRSDEARTGAARFLEGAAQVTTEVHDFRDGFFPYQGTLKETFEALKERVEPDLVFTHHRSDRHQDHRAVAELTWNTFRDHLVFEYEIPKYEGDLGQPNWYQPLTHDVAQRKVSLLLEVFATQHDKPWFTADAFQGLMRVRGIEAGGEVHFAEAFHARKLRGALS